MVAVFKREMRGFFLSPIGYVFMGVFLLISGFFFSTMNLLQSDPRFLGVLASITFLFTIIVPILTMRLISDETRMKTDQLLYTSPLSLTSIVVGKYLAALAVFAFTLMVTLVYPYILSIYGSIALTEIIGGYIGFFFLGACFISVGLFASSLTENQIIAAVVTFCLLLFFWLMDVIMYSVTNKIVAAVLDWISLLRRFEEFTMGILNLEHIVYYISFSILFLFLTIRTIERKRWA